MGVCVCVGGGWLILGKEATTYICMQCSSVLFYVGHGPQHPLPNPLLIPLYLSCAFTCHLFTGGQTYLVLTSFLCHISSRLTLFTCFEMLSKL